MRDVRALRTLALLDLEAHPAEAAIDRVTIVIDPTPGRVVQHTLYTRAQPTPEQLSTLLARLGALMGADRFGVPVAVDTDRPGAFAMAAFATDHDAGKNRGDRNERRENVSRNYALSDHDGKNRVLQQAQDKRPLMVSVSNHEPLPSRLRSPGSRVISGEAGQSAEGATAAALSPQPFHNAQPLTSALRRCRQPVPARVAVADGRPVRITTDRRGFAGGTVTHCAGPWRTSGNWWAGEAGEAGRTGQTGGENARRPVQPIQPIPPVQPAWNRDEWDVSLSDGAVYRVFRDRDADRWFIDAIVD
jgi:hypothetical protein